MSPLWLLLDRVVTSGNLTFIDADGRARTYGDNTGPQVVVRLHDKPVEWRIALDPGLAIAEAFMDARLNLEQGSVYEFLELLIRNTQRTGPPGSARLLDRMRYATRWARQYNPVGRAARNASHHYDIPPEIYDLFLDPDWQYSCAYFPHENVDLAEAQRAKKRHIAAKLRVSPGQDVLDIGSGWGGLGLSLAQLADARVTGITLSNEQLRRARERAKKMGLDSQVRFELRDYRKVEEKFDRIVSVGMFEHVGVNHYQEFFNQVYKLLKDDGVALLHSIGRSDTPGITNPFIEKYIFPGGYIPSLSEVIPAIERAGLVVADIEILRLHYAHTLRAWRDAFMARRDEAKRLMGERFCRMWEFYLAGSELAFRYQGMMVFQIQLIKQVDALPLTRDYMVEDERRLEAIEAGGGQRPRLAGT
ncbi:SAM-dependent methyltransferase [Dichotomicrobium thermohalophilum]|uniref:Cyclopropane-fatty-acyl-phospholipid synthase n=1 Tax=Dichotomicrobium thermohalophilum TaxID=933063 RepID=A0A397Q4Q8_9HYPH|nr:cyclopropane-fatty-acyl-phospholipid synthase family protein [Dichotomicrobium thermohalophilum]RIA56470.1 cyclopropane-fatty-acyl-phospholipid synthase [Dichotomicrobium thermohalophilum]